MLTAKLILERFNKRHELLERREQPSRCFTKSFIELLYIAHAQIQSGAPYSMTDIRGAPADIDSEVEGPGTLHGPRGTKPNLAIGSPPGHSQALYPAGSGGIAYAYAKMLQSILLGEHLGIQLGGGATPVTPTDHFMETRFGHGIRPADGGNVTFESYTTGDDADQESYGTRWAGQSFRAQHQHKLYSVKLKLYREGLPGTLTVDIYAGEWDSTDIDPVGTPLVTGTTDGDTLTEEVGGEWREITFPSQIEIVPGMNYVIVIHCAGDSGNSIHWLYDTSSALYYRGIRISSTDSGGSWTTGAGDDHMFEEIGRSSGELQYGGCELTDILFSGLAPHDGEFTIRRYFKNNSGESREVNEAGIYAAGARYQYWTYAFCIARDIVTPAVTVADTELLCATYAPQITV